jgi:hypothetical protein
MHCGYNDQYRHAVEIKAVKGQKVTNSRKLKSAIVRYCPKADNEPRFQSGIRPASYETAP